MVRMFLLWLVTIIFAFGLPGCGGGHRPAGLITADGSAAALPAIDLDAALAEVSAQAPPPGVDAALFREMQRALAEALAKLYGPGAEAQARQASALSRAEMNQAWCLQARISAANVVTLRFSGRQVADYDLNSEVSAADLVPLAVYFQQMPQFDADGLPLASGANELIAHCDGDSNTEVNSADIVPIAVNFLHRTVGWRVYTGTGAGQDSIAWSPAYLAGDGDGVGCTLAYNRSQATGEVSRYSLDFDLPEIPAGMSGWVKVVAFDGATEGLAAIMPLALGAHQAQSCELCHNVATYAFRGTAGLCDACHATPPEDSTAAWADAPGMHSQCLSCHTQHGFALTEPNSVCATCHSDKLEASHGGGLTTCLDCHFNSHLPVADLTQLNCEGCHLAPPEQPALTWDDAPGLHDQCLACHDQPQHGVAPEPTRAFCNTCHSQTHGGTAACISCHLYQHVPTVPAG